MKKYIKTILFIEVLCAFFSNIVNCQPLRLSSMVDMKDLETSFSMIVDDVKYDSSISYFPSEHQYWFTMNVSEDCFSFPKNRERNGFGCPIIWAGGCYCNQDYSELGPIILDNLSSEDIELFNASRVRINLFPIINREGKVLAANLGWWAVDESFFWNFDINKLLNICKRYVATFTYDDMGILEKAGLEYDIPGNIVISFKNDKIDVLTFYLPTREKDNTDLQFEILGPGSN